VDGFLSDPCGFFNNSYTQMHSMTREQLLELQRVGIARRFEQQIDRVAMVGRLAGRQGITRLDDVEDVVPLLFDHTMYKSYPVVLLAQQQYGKLTEWLSRLTSVDLSSADVSGCSSIDSWLSTLVAQTEVDVLHTSGTSGTMSFVPWSRVDLRHRAKAFRVSNLQPFGTSPTPEVLEEPMHFAANSNRWRSGSYEIAELCGGDQALGHYRTQTLSADILWLAARLRLAAVRGDTSRVQVPQTLLSRRDELVRNQAEEPLARQAWIDTIASLQNERLYWNLMNPDVYEIAAEQLGRGQRWSFAPGSVLVTAGGSKGRTLPADWKAVVADFTDLRIVHCYGMSEMALYNVMCDAGRYHLQPWVVPFVLDPDTSDLMPRSGVQTGRFAFFDLFPDSHWGGLISGDEVEIDFDGTCTCGATTPHIGPGISRLSEKRGGDDKISCTATPHAYDEAMHFLTSY
jgi:hypothetical protein